MGSSQGAQASLCIQSAAINTSATPIEFVSTSLVQSATIIDTNGIRGTRSRNVASTRAGTYAVSGPIVINPSPNDLDTWLTYILGGNDATNYYLEETLPTFWIGYDPITGSSTNQAFEFAGCYVNRATFRGRPQEPIELELEIFGKTSAALTYPSLSHGVATADQPYVFSDFVWTFDSVSRPLLGFELVIDNVLDARFANSLTATDITPQDRVITFTPTSTFTTTELSALFNIAQAGVASSTLVGTHTADSYSVSFNFGTLQAPNQMPPVTGKTEITLPIEFTSRTSAVGEELNIDNDSTPT
jgi:hypothetical protein